MTRSPEDTAEGEKRLEDGIAPHPTLRIVSSRQEVDGRFEERLDAGLRRLLRKPTGTRADDEDPGPSAA